MKAVSFSIADITEWVSSLFCGYLSSGNNSTGYEFAYLDNGTEIFTKADLSEVPKTKSKLKKRELAKTRSKVSEDYQTEFM